MKLFAKKFLLVGVLSLSLSLFFCEPSFATPAPPNLRGQISGQVQAGNAVAGLGGAAPQEIMARVIQIILSVVGITFTALIVMAGYNIFTSAGDESKVEKAKNTIKACVIGLAITLGAYSLTTFIGKNAVDITTKGQQTQVDNRLDYDRLKNDITGAGDVGGEVLPSGDSL